MHLALPVYIPTARLIVTLIPQAPLPMSASKHQEGPVPKLSSASHCTNKKEHKQTKSLSHQPVTSLSLYALRNLHIQHAAHRTPPTISIWEAELDELPTTYEQIGYGGKPEMGEKRHAAIASLQEQATQINIGHKINNTGFGDVERDLSGVGAWADHEH